MTGILTNSCCLQKVQSDHFAETARGRYSLVYITFCAAVESESAAVSFRRAFSQQHSCGYLTPAKLSLALLCKKKMVTLSRQVSRNTIPLKLLLHKTSLPSPSLLGWTMLQRSMLNTTAQSWGSVQVLSIYSAPIKNANQLSLGS